MAKKAKAKRRTIKPTRRQGKNTERHLVQQLTKEIYKIDPDVYVKVDTDSPGRVVKSGWDFLVSKNGHVLFIEAKRVTNRNWQAENLLTTFQKMTASEVEASDGFYIVLVFTVLKDTPTTVHVLQYEKFFGKEKGNFVLQTAYDCIEDGAEYLVRCLK